MSVHPEQLAVWDDSRQVDDNELRVLYWYYEFSGSIFAVFTLIRRLVRDVVSLRDRVSKLTAKIAEPSALTSALLRSGFEVSAEFSSGKCRLIVQKFGWDQVFEAKTQVEALQKAIAFTEEEKRNVKGKTAIQSHPSRADS